MAVTKCFGGHGNCSLALCGVLARGSLLVIKMVELSLAAERSGVVEDLGRAGNTHDGFPLSRMPSSGTGAHSNNPAHFAKAPVTRHGCPSGSDRRIRTHAFDAACSANDYLPSPANKGCCTLFYFLQPPPLTARSVGHEGVRGKHLRGRTTGRSSKLLDSQIDLRAAMVLFSFSSCRSKAT